MTAVWKRELRSYLKSPVGYVYLFLYLILDVKFSMIVSCCTMWLCRVSLCIYLCRVWGFGPIAVWIGMACDWMLRSIIFTARFHSRKWLNHHVID